MARNVLLALGVHFLALALVLGVFGYAVFQAKTDWHNAPHKGDDYSRTVIGKASN